MPAGATQNTYVGLRTRTRTRRQGGRRSRNGAVTGRCRLQIKSPSAARPRGAGARAVPCPEAGAACGPVGSGDRPLMTSNRNASYGMGPDLRGLGRQWSCAVRRGVWKGGGRMWIPVPWPARPPAWRGFWERGHGKSTPYAFNVVPPGATHTWGHASVRTHNAKGGGDPGMGRPLGEAVGR